MPLTIGVNSTDKAGECGFGSLPDCVNLATELSEPIVSVLGAGVDHHQAEALELVPGRMIGKIKGRDETGVDVIVELALAHRCRKVWNPREYPSEEIRLAVCEVDFDCCLVV